MSPVPAEHAALQAARLPLPPHPPECSWCVAHFWGPFLGELLHTRVGRRGLQSYVLHAAVLRAVLHPSHFSPMQADELSNPFGQISLSRQGSAEAPDPSSAMFQSSLISQHPQQTGFIMATPGQPIPTSNYSASGHTAPTQQVLQPQGYIQPPQQVRAPASPKGMCTSMRRGAAEEQLLESGSLLLLLLICDGSAHSRMISASLSLWGIYLGTPLGHFWLIGLVTSSGLTPLSSLWGPAGHYNL